MKKNRASLIFAFLLILAVAACNLQPAVALTPDQNAGATAVAQTVEALIQQTTPGGNVTEPTVPATAIPVTAISLTNTPAANASPAAATNTPGGPAGQICDNAEFISETIPDGTIEAPGAAIVKTWRLKNIGTCTWTSSYNAVFLNGDAMGAPSAVPLTGNVAPGQTVDISINIQAPAATGNYTGNWTMRNASGVLFGLGKNDGPFWVKISVVAPTATPTATATGVAIILPGVPLKLLPVVSQMFGQTSIAASSSGQAAATCPAGSVLTGGGFAGSTALLVYSNFASGNTWQADARNLSTAAHGLTVYAECLSNSGGSTQQQVAQANVAANATGQAVVTCPTGSVVTGGGFASNPYLDVYNSSAMGNGWEADAQNTASLSEPLNAYAICLSGTKGTSQQVLNQATVAAVGSGNAVAVCPASTYLTSGGFAASQNFFIFNESATGSGWQVYAQNGSGADKLLNAYAVCLTLP